MTVLSAVLPKFHLNIKSVRKLDAIVFFGHCVQCNALAVFSCLHSIGPTLKVGSSALLWSMDSTNFCTTKVVAQTLCLTQTIFNLLQFILKTENLPFTYEMINDNNGITNELICCGSWGKGIKWLMCPAFGCCCMLCSSLDSILDPVSRCYMVQQVICAEYCVMATLAVAVHWSLVQWSSILLDHAGCMNLGTQTKKTKRVWLVWESC